MQDKLISIVTANYNSQRFIIDTYCSIATQSYKNWEWLVTDDCSTDKSLELLKKIALKDSRVKIFQNQRNYGAAKSRNNSIQKAKGDIIAFIDADDLWEPEKLEEQSKFMFEGGYGFSFTPYKLITEKGVFQNSVVDLFAPGEIDYKKLLLKKATFGCSTVMLDRSIVGNITMPNLRTGQDYATWLSILRIGYRAYLLRMPLTSYRIVKGSISRNKLKKALRQWQIYRDIENLSLLYTTYCFIFYAFRSLFRSLF
jgi:teichuronic acid biosynthesis glycosyltransferase TuaG